jgi:hypothetical protein
LLQIPDTLNKGKIISQYNNMDILLNKHDKIISLGSTCFIKLFMDGYGIKQETSFFDWVGSAMWGINKLIECNFENVFNRNDYKFVQTVIGTEIMVMNTNFYLIFKHDFSTIPLTVSPALITYQEKQIIDKKFQDFKNTYTRRFERFKCLLNGSDKILFIRQEQNMKNRIIRSDYIKLFKQPELYYLIEFTKIIKKMYPVLKFNIIYISHTCQNDYLPDHNIIIINDSRGYVMADWMHCTDKYKKLFEDNTLFLSNILLL